MKAGLLQIEPCCFDHNQGKISSHLSLILWISRHDMVVGALAGWRLVAIVDAAVSHGGLRRSLKPRCCSSFCIRTVRFDLPQTPEESNECVGHSLASFVFQVGSGRDSLNKVNPVKPQRAKLGFAPFYSVI